MNKWQLYKNRLDCLNTTKKAPRTKQMSNKSYKDTTVPKQLQKRLENGMVTKSTSVARVSSPASLIKCLQKSLVLEWQKV